MIPHIYTSPAWIAHVWSFLSGYHSMSCSYIYIYICLYVPKIRIPYVVCTYVCVCDRIYIYVTLIGCCYNFILYTHGRTHAQRYSWTFDLNISYQWLFDRTSKVLITLRIALEVYLCTWSTSYMRQMCLYVSTTRIQIW